MARGAALFYYSPTHLENRSMPTLHHHRFANVVMASAIAGILALSMAACDKQAEPSRVTPQNRTMGNVIDDTVITTRIKSALMADPKINSYDFKVETRKGEVMLSGFVDNQAQLDLANSTVRAVEGVKSVQTNVEVKGGNASIGNKVDDGITTGKVKAALLADPSIQSLDIHVVTRVDEVQLSGFVNSQQQMDRAMKVTATTQGVRHVSNEMQIKK
jgi:hyperosmotically inducible protein